MGANEWDRVAKMCGEFTREVGVLLFTFGMLEPFLDWTLHKNAGESAARSALLLVAAGIVAFVIGVIVEIRWRRGIDAFAPAEE